MDIKGQNILVWLPSPLGDAIMCTPALKAVRKHFLGKRITFLASPAVKDVLLPSDLCNSWIKPDGFLKLAKKLKEFDAAILFKNSLGSAATVFFAGIDQRIGYSRELRGIFLTDSILPEKQTVKEFKPLPMIDYYLNLCQHLGCDVTDRKMELSVSTSDFESAKQLFSEIIDNGKPLIILVPGGAFGPSKLWDTQRYAALADKLVEKYNADIVVSVAPTETEIRIAKDICRQSQNKLLNLGDYKLSLGKLKALFSHADLVITNDTGPRHIAIALNRKVITLFGPNNNEWTQTGHPDEVQIVGTADCAPCDKPVCDRSSHFCMDSITVEKVYAAACGMLN